MSKPIYLMVSVLLLLYTRDRLKITVVEIKKQSTILTEIALLIYVLNLTENLRT